MYHHNIISGYEFKREAVKLLDKAATAAGWKRGDWLTRAQAATRGLTIQRGAEPVKLMMGERLCSFYNVAQLEGQQPEPKQAQQIPPQPMPAQLTLFREGPVEIDQRAA